MAQQHRSDPRILGRRTLQADHRALAAMLRPGLAVLDVGCGIGSITFGIAQAVAPEGRVLGIDRDSTLGARQSYALANLRFEEGDATQLSLQSDFDIATAARTLQWIDQPALAVEGMRRAVKPGGCLVLLDYNHLDNFWEPEPPEAFRMFYRAFLAWRDANHWDNRMGDSLADLLHNAGLVDIEVHSQDEVATRGEPDFVRHADVWRWVAEGALADQLIAGGFLTPEDRAAAVATFTPWIADGLQRQTMVLRAAIGRVP